MPENTINTPSGIRFGCSGCGNCCLQWPVPITERDYKQLNCLDLSQNRTEDIATNLFRKLSSSTDRLQSFTHTLEKRGDGKCEFLTGDNRCYLHQTYGSQSKPTMCRLFPYYFTVTPDSVLGSVSFASSAVLFNSGELLCEQKDILEEKLREFRELFPDDTSGWNTLQTVDGVPLSWKEFSTMDAEFFGTSKEKTFPRCLPEKLMEMSARATQALDNPKLAEKTPKLEASPKIVDQLLLKYLNELYFPKDTGAPLDLNTQGLLSEMVSAPQTVAFGSTSFSKLIKYKLGKLPEPHAELIDRFFYCRAFAKLYFGPGFHHLSLLAGIHHMTMLNVLLKLKIKEQMISKNLTVLEFTDFAELVRSLEQRLTQLSLSAQTKATFEVLLSSPQRAERITFLAD